MKFSALLVLLLTTGFVLCGCRGLQSEFQKTELRKAMPTAVLNGSTLRLSSSLTRLPQTKGFDLKGVLTITSDSNAFPKHVEAYHLALKPSWTGFPGYYVMNFFRRDGVWKQANHNPNFSASTMLENNRVVIEFMWKHQGTGMATKPEHFAAYDVSVSLSDLKKERHILTTLNVPVQ
ncbi:MAG: hypothetical protein H7Y43_17805 [Akkermansiaceae bacterium]|nr:hypothetical protein [Verrucomicrobiales bacterium]